MYQERYIQHKNCRLFQLMRLQHSDTLLVFFHGIGDSHLNFIDFFHEAVLLEFDLCVADLLGHGRSSSAENYSFYHQADALYAQLSSLLLHYKKIVFVPHSMGGIHATLLAANTFFGKINGIFAIETSVTQFGSFIAEKVSTIVAEKKDFSAWFKNFRDDIGKNIDKNDNALQTYYCGLQLVREEAFLSNALEMFSLATVLKGEVFSSKIGQLFASLPMPKTYCLGSLGKQLPSVPFLEKNHINIEYFPTDSHWVAQTCFRDFCDRLVKFIRKL